MKLYIEQKLLSLVDTFSVYDENHRQKYYVENQLFSIGHKLHVYSSNSGEIGVVKQRVLVFLPEFVIEVYGSDVGVIRKEFSFLEPKYHCDFNGWKIRGDMFGFTYQVVDGLGRPVATISRELWHMSDHYVLDIVNPSNELYVLMLALAIDAVKCSQN